MSDAEEAGLVVGTVEGVLRITIDRPRRRGALTASQQRLMATALEDASTDDSLRVVLIDSTGDDFCAGADWVSANSGEEEVKPRPGATQRRTPLQAHRVIALIQEIQLPVVAAVRGWAAGLGCQLALASDFVIATTSSQFWAPFVQRGFTPDSGSTWLLPRLVGVARAKEMLMLGRPISGEQAADWGLIYSAVPDLEFEAAVEALVDELRTSATVAVGLTKRSIHRGLDGGIVEAMENESMALELSSRTSDFREGLRAFADRRDARFEGR